MSKHTKLAFGVEPAKRLYRLRLARYQGLSESVADFVRAKGRTCALLDVGVGSGRTMRYLEARGVADDITFYGMDIDPGRLSTIYNREKWRLIMGDVEGAIPFEPGKIDIVIIEQVLEHIENPQLVLKEIARVLSPGGMLIVGVPTFPPFVEACRRAGVSLLKRWFDMERGHVQTFTMRSLIDAVNRSGLYDITDVRGFRVASGGILSPLEDKRWFWRFNVFLGRTIPSFCTEIQLLAIKRGK